MLWENLILPQIDYVLGYDDNDGDDDCDDDDMLSSAGILSI